MAQSPLATTRLDDVIDHVIGPALDIAALRQRKAALGRAARFHRICINSGRPFDPTWRRENLEESLKAVIKGAKPYEPETKSIEVEGASIEENIWTQILVDAIISSSLVKGCHPDSFCSPNTCPGNNGNRNNTTKSPEISASANVLEDEIRINREKSLVEGLPSYLHFGADEYNYYRNQVVTVLANHLELELIRQKTKENAHKKKKLKQGTGAQKNPGQTPTDDVDDDDDEIGKHTRHLEYVTKHETYDAILNVGIPNPVDREYFRRLAMEKARESVDKLFCKSG